MVHRHQVREGQGVVGQQDPQRSVVATADRRDQSELPGSVEEISGVGEGLVDRDAAAVHATAQRGHLLLHRGEEICRGAPGGNVHGDNPASRIGTNRFNCAME